MPKAKAKQIKPVKAWAGHARNFPIGYRVQLSAQGRAANIVWPKYHDRAGTIVGYYAGISPKVLWDGRKTATGYADEFLEPITPLKQKGKKK